MTGAFAFLPKGRKPSRARRGRFSRRPWGPSSSAAGPTFSFSRWGPFSSALESTACRASTTRGPGCRFPSCSPRGWGIVRARKRAGIWARPSDAGNPHARTVKKALSWGIPLGAVAGATIGALVGREKEAFERIVAWILGGAFIGLACFGLWAYARKRDPRAFLIVGFSGVLGVAILFREKGAGWMLLDVAAMLLVLGTHYHLRWRRWVRGLPKE